MTLTRDELRDELLAMANARRELSRADEQYLIEGFLDKLDAEIDARITSRVGNFKPVKSGGQTAIAIMALILALPLSGIAVIAGWQGLLVAWSAILLVVYLTTRK